MTMASRLSSAMVRGRFMLSLIRAEISHQILRHSGEQLSSRMVRRQTCMALTSSFTRA